jgi:hypothetical protein
MVEDKMEDETYSLIFASLKHPIRRRILRMLADKPLTHSEILDVLNIDSGHLSKHLENLGDLTFKDKTGHYRLSSFGKAAVKLMCGVELTQSQCRKDPRNLFTKTYSIILVLMLLFASAYFVSYVAASSSGSVTTRWAFTPAESSIGVGETLKLNFTLAELESAAGKQSIGVNISSAPSTSLIPGERTFTEWYEYSMWLEMEPGKCYSTRDLVYNGANGSSQDFIDFSGVFWEQLETMNASDTSYVIVEFSPEPIIRFSPDLLNTINTTLQTSNIANFYLVYFPKLSVNVYAPDGSVMNDFLQRSPDPYFTVTSYSPSESYWISESSNATSFSSSEVSLNQLGLYRLNITNNGPYRWDENFSLYLKSQRMERPYFYLGIAGLVAALGYLIFVATGRIRRSKSKVYWTDD